MFAILISLLIPIFYQLEISNHVISNNVQIKPSFLIVSVIDAAKIIGLPALKIVGEKARLAQQPTYLERESWQMEQPVPWRKLFFRNYFQQS